MITGLKWSARQMQMQHFEVIKENVFSWGFLLMWLYEFNLWCRYIAATSAS